MQWKGGLGDSALAGNQHWVCPVAQCPLGAHCWLVKVAWAGRAGDESAQAPW